MLVNRGCICIKRVSADNTNICAEVGIEPATLQADLRREVSKVFQIKQKKIHDY